MFTGIVAEVGVVRHVEETASGRRIEIGAERVLERLDVDDSIAVAGVCLTVVARDDRSFTVDTVPETLSRTTLGSVARGTRLDLEPAATPTTALGGHIVQGHVDGTVALVERHAEGEGARLRFALPPDLDRYVVMKGFIAIDGVSLTVAAVTKGVFDIALIPHTSRQTTLGSLRVGDLVNVEVDIIGKYVEHLLDARERERHRQ
ncbi:MAG: riboflavin synthase [Chloroflexota bacterium]|nr:riboflavin synthase [Chloroflexota bacterium]MDE3101956.1 riboflavin synthase [Chloroflexota bacterium]